MSNAVIPGERFFFGNDHWRSYHAINEIEVYCDLLEHLQEKIKSLEIRGEGEELTLINVQAMISSYAIEIAIKSFWALDNPAECVPHTHNLVKVWDGLREETVKSLEQLELTSESLEEVPAPFTSNRYSMEYGGRDITVYQAPFLRALIPLLRDKLENTRKELLKPPFGELSP